MKAGVGRMNLLGFGLQRLWKLNLDQEVGPRIIHDKQRIRRAKQ